MNLIWVYREGVVYSSVDGGEAPFLAPVYLDRLDKSARDFTNSFEKDILWKHVETIPAKTVRYETDYVSTGLEEAGATYWSKDDFTVSIPTGLGPVLQVGQELYTTVINTEGSTLFNGTIVKATGIQDDHITAGIAYADTHVSLGAGLSVTTMDILDDALGITTNFGQIRNFDCSIWDGGSPILYVSPSDIYPNTQNGLTNIKPSFPNYIVQVGAVTTAGIDGTITVEIKGDINDTFTNFWNGTIRESFFFDIVDDGTGGLKGQLSPADGHPDLTAFLSDGFYMIPTTPPLEVALIAGTDSIPQMNYVYIVGSTKTITVSTSGFPNNIEHIKIGSYYLQSASVTLGNGPLKSHPWNDHVVSNHSFQGHLSHITQRLRQEGAKWSSGTEGGSTIVSPTEAYITVTGGIVYQLHEQIFPAFDTQLVDEHFHVWNAFTDPFAETSNVYDVDEDSLGNSLNNSSFSLVLFGSVNSGSSMDNYSQLFIGVPSGTYPKNSPDLAVSDAYNYSNKSIPAEFRGTGFLIARYTYVRQANGAISLYDIEDLTDSSATGGGGSGGTGVTTFVALTDTPNIYAGSENYTVKVGAGGAGLEFIDVIESISKPSVSTEFLNSYDSLTGLFTSAQPQYSEIGNTPDLGIYVPYTGAISDVDLEGWSLYNTKKITANDQIIVSSGTSPTIVIEDSFGYWESPSSMSIHSTGTYIGLVKTDALSVNKEVRLNFNNITDGVIRYYALPDVDGTLALTSDLSGFGDVFKVGTPLNLQMSAWTGEN